MSIYPKTHTLINLLFRVSRFLQPVSLTNVSLARSTALIFTSDLDLGFLSAHLATNAVLIFNANYLTKGFLKEVHNEQRLR